MTLLEWESRFELGVDAMDHEHQHLVRLMNALYAVHQEGTRPAQAQALAELGAYTTKHFADEEAYLERTGYSGLAMHRVHHQKLLRTFGEHAGRFTAGAPLEDRFFYFLRFWLASHICGIDMKYSPAELSAPGSRIAAG